MLNDVAMTPRRFAFFILVVLVTGFAAYQPALRSGFFWDDDVFITANPQMHSWRGLLSIWSEPSSSPHYYPLLLTVFWVLSAFFGDSATGYHFANILLHVVNAILLSLLGQRLGVRYAWVAALLFLLHPINVQSVAWITEMKNTLSTLFILAGCLIWISSPNGLPPRLGASRWWSVAILFAGAMLTKSTSLIMLLVLVLADANLRRPVLNKGYWLSLAPLLVAGLAFAIFSASFERSLARAGAMPVPELWQQVGLAAWSVFFYLGKLAWPASLAPVYPAPSITPVAVLFWLLALGFLFGVAAFAWKRGHKSPLSALVLFVVFLFPIPLLGIQFTRWYGPVTDHFAYVPSAVFCLAMAAAVGRLVGGSVARHRALVAGVAAVCLVFGWLTFRHADDWRTGRVWELAAVNAPDSLATLNYANFLSSEGRGSDALLLLAKMHAKLGDKSFVAQAYGTQLAVLGRTADAERVMREGLRKTPGDLQLWRALGTMLVNADRPGEAVPALQKSLPANPVNRIALASAMVRAGLVPDAVAQIPSLPAPTMSNAPALADLARDLQSAGAYGEAESLLISILRRFPLSHHIRIGLGYVLLDRGASTDAQEQFAQVLRLAPGNPFAVLGLAECLQTEGRAAQAAGLLEENSRNFPHEELHNAYAWFLATSPDSSLRNPALALQLMEKIPGDRMAASHYFQGTLAAALAANGRFAEASTAAEKAIVLATAQGDDDFIAGTRERLKLYRADQAYVQPATSKP